MTPFRSNGLRGPNSPTLDYGDDKVRYVAILREISNGGGVDTANCATLTSIKYTKLQQQTRIARSCCMSMQEMSLCTCFAYQIAAYCAIYCSARLVEIHS